FASLMVEPKHLVLLQFDKIVELVRLKCHSKQARTLCDDLLPQIFSEQLSLELKRTEELKMLLSGNGYFPNLEHEDILPELNYLSRDGASLHEEQLLSFVKTLGVVNSLVRFVKGKKQILPLLHDVAFDLLLF